MRKRKLLVVNVIVLDEASCKREGTQGEMRLLGSLCSDKRRVSLGTDLCDSNAASLFLEDLYKQR